MSNFAISVPKDKLLDGCWTLLTLLYLYFTFIGIRPMQDDDAASRTSGNLADQAFLIGMGCLSLCVLALRVQGALHLARRGWVVLLLLAWCVASTLWSDFPDITFRRSVALCLGTLSPFAIAVGMRDPWRLLAILTFGLALVVIVNLLSVVVNPGYAITEIGVRGIYTQKNVTGMVGTIAVIVDVAWIISARTRTNQLAGYVFLLLSAAFLAITGSKTSMAISVAMVLVIPAFMRTLASGVVARRAAVIAVVLAACAFALALWASNLDRTQILELLFGDPTFSKRTDIWAFAWQEISKRFWLGFGFGAFWDVGEAHNPLFRAPPGTFLSEVQYGVINQAHDGYLELWLQAGFVAVVLAVIAIADATFTAGRLNMTLHRTWNVKGLALVCLMVMLVYDFNNVMEATLFNNGLLLNNVAMIAIFVTYRLQLSSRVA